MDFQRFFVENNKIRVYKYLCTYTQKVWDYSEYEKPTESDDGENTMQQIDFDGRKQSLTEHTVYLAESSELLNNTPETFEHDFIDKHANLDIVKIEPLDVSDIEWMDGTPIDPDTADDYAFIEKIYNMGKEAYEQSLVTTTEDYMTDLDYRLCLLEMGL